jgi:hypothetical protein
MEITNPLLTRWICVGLVMAILIPPAAVAQDEKQDATPVPTSQTSSPTPDASPTTSAPAEAQASQATPAQLPDSPDKVQPQADNQGQPSTAAPLPTHSGTRQDPKALGAAAKCRVSGTAFKPAGAAIAQLAETNTPSTVGA